MTAVHVGSMPVREVYVGSKMVWSATVQITLGTGLQARDQLRAALTERWLNYQTVEKIPFDIELIGTGSTQSMFYNCAALTSVPDMDTSGVTTMSNMFTGCAALTHAPSLDTSQVTEMGGMFWDCLALTSVPDMDTSNVTNMRYMFYDCAALTDGNVLLIGRHPQVDTTGMITGSGLTREPFDTEVVQITLGTRDEARDQLRAALSVRGMDYQTVTEIPFDIELVGTGSTRDMFNGCAALTSVPDMHTSQVTNVTGMFRGCSSLTDGNVRLIGRHPNVTTLYMILGSGMTREPFYDAAGNPI